MPAEDPMQSVWMPNMQWECAGDIMSLANSINNVPPPPDPRCLANSITNVQPPPDPRSFAAVAMPPVEAQIANPSMVRLRGLPFDLTSQDVLAFFAQHGVADRVSAVCNAVQIMSKSNGKPSGNAIVQLRNAEDIDVVQRTLHLATIGSRYVEVLAHPPAAQAPASKLQQDSANRLQQNAVQSAPPQAMAGSTMYSILTGPQAMSGDAWLLSQLAASMAHCSAEHQFVNSVNPVTTGFKTVPHEEFGQPWFELRV